MCLLDAGIPPEAIWDTPVERKTTISFSKRVFYWSMDACKKTLRKHAVDKHVSQADAMSQACDPMTPIGILIANEEAARLDERLPAQVCREMLDLPAKQKLAVFLMLRQILADLLPFDDFIELAIEVRAFHSEFDGPDDKNLSKNANRGVSRLRKALLTGIILLGSLLGSTAAAPAVDGHVNQLARVARDSGHVNLVAGHVNAVDGHVN
jgi:hypothetical protein